MCHPERSEGSDIRIQVRKVGNMMGKIIGTIKKGFITTLLGMGGIHLLSAGVFAAEPVHIDEDTFPDEKLRAYISTSFDKDKDGYLSTEEIEAVTEIKVTSKNIYDLKGIELFPELEVLEANTNYFSTIDVSRNPKLRDLQCGIGNLESLDVSKNPLLEGLSCSRCKITELDVSNNPELTSLDCYSDHLTELDVTNNPKLIYLWCFDNQLTELDLSKNTALEDLRCTRNSLAELDLSNAPGLKMLQCHTNQLTELDVSTCTELKTLYCYGNKLSSLDLRNNTKLQVVECQDNNLGDQRRGDLPDYNLTLGDKPDLVSLNYSNNQMFDQVDLSGCESLTALICEENLLGKLTVDMLPNLKTLYCGGQASLSILDVSKNTLLETLHCSGDLLKQLDLSNNTKLKDLDCSSNPLDTLDISQNTELKNLDCSGCMLTSLDTSKNTNLGFFVCNNNDLESLDLTGNTALYSLHCYGNNLTELDVRFNPSLRALNCTSNPLKLLELRNQGTMDPLYCPGTTIRICTDEDLGWNKIGDDRYYVVDDGTTPKNCHFLTGHQVIDGGIYEFDENGVLLSSIVTPTDISVNPTTVRMTCLDTVTLQVVTSPADVAPDALVWSSEDESVATVDGSGTITPVAIGTTTITVSSVYDSSVQFSVPVAVLPVISLNSEQLDLLTGGDAEIKLTKNTEYKFHSESVYSRDTDVAKLISGGNGYKVRGVGAGETDICIVLVDQMDRSYQFTVHVVVSSLESMDTNIEKIVLLYQGEELPEDMELLFFEGESFELTAEIYITDVDTPYLYSFDHPAVQTDHGRVRLAWETTNSDIAVANNGHIDIRSGGTTYITAKGLGTTVMSNAVTVTAIERPVALRSLSIQGDSSVEMGQKLYLKPVFTPGNASNKEVEWISEDPDVAEVNEYGMVTGMSVGTTTIRVTSKADPTITATIFMEVTPILINSIRIMQGTVTESDGKYLFEGTKILSEGDWVILRHSVDEAIYLSAVVNDDAACKDLDVASGYYNDNELYADDVTNRFIGVTDSESIIRISMEEPGEGDLTFIAGDGSGVHVNLMVRVVPYDDWFETKLGEKQHYTQGVMDTGFTKIDGKTYYFSVEGNLQTGWKKIGGKWYYLGTDGVMVTGWKKLGNKWYFFGTDGVMRTGWQKMSGKWSYFGTDGVLSVGWKQIGKKWYLFDSNGYMQTGWKKSGNNWYYFGTDGAMVTGWKKIGKWYYFKTGAMVSGWQKIGSKWYFFPGGAMKTGWLSSGGKWYFFNKDGEMVTGSVKIGTKTYQFSSSGVCLNP